LVAPISGFALKTIATLLGAMDLFFVFASASAVRRDVLFASTKLFALPDR
jgi:hypothetical protein